MNRIAFLTLASCLLLNSTVIAEDKLERETRIAKYLTGAKFVGRFTVEGANDFNPKSEEYTISKCEPLDEEDAYRLTARIKYGDIDNEVPIDLKILWAGKTPVITLDNVWIPGMDAFDARVMIRNNRYAGTWTHGDKGGLLFGRIEHTDTDNRKDK